MLFGLRHHSNPTSDELSSASYFRSHPLVFSTHLNYFGMDFNKVLQFQLCFLLPCYAGFDESSQISSVGYTAELSFDDAVYGCFSNIG